MKTATPEQTERLRRLRLELEEFSESFVQSSGRGGQNVNKVATCVQLTHVPTGFSVKCMSHRTQAQNRHEALDRLLDKIENHRRELQRERRQAQEKRKRAARKRPAGVKRRILADKRRQSEKKVRRRKVDGGE
jgi:peptide chain release factor